MNNFRGMEEGEVRSRVREKFTDDIVHRITACGRATCRKINSNKREGELK